MENEKIQEYIDIVYDNYDTSILNFPTALGTPNFLFNKIVKESNKNRQHTLFLVRNKIILNQIFNEFYFYMGENSNTHGINTFYEFSNGSMVIFKICNQVENPIFTHSENIIIYNIDFNRNNEFILELIDKIKTFDKRLFVSCNIKDGVERVIMRKLNDSIIYQKSFSYNLSPMTSEIRRIKLQKIKRIYERRNDRSVSMAE